MEERRKQESDTRVLTICARCEHPDHGHFDCPVRVINLTHSPVDGLCYCTGDRRQS